MQKNEVHVQSCEQLIETSLFLTDIKVRQEMYLFYSVVCDVSCKKSYVQYSTVQVCTGSKVVK